MSTVFTESPPLKIALGPDETGVFEAGLPVLAGEAVEALFDSARPAGRIGAISLFQAGGWLLVAACARDVVGEPALMRCQPFQAAETQRPHSLSPNCRTSHIIHGQLFIGTSFI